MGVQTSTPVTYLTLAPGGLAGYFTWNQKIHQLRETEVRAGCHHPLLPGFPVPTAYPAVALSWGSGHPLGRYGAEGR